MAYHYIDTPRTEVDGNATYMTNGLRSAARHNLSALDSVENSFQSPSKDHDLLRDTSKSRSPKQRDFSLRTPRAGPAPRSSRNALRDRKNLPAAPPPKGEFTPLMKSVTKNNFLRNTNQPRVQGIPETPAFLKDDYREQDTPGLPKIDASYLYEGGSMYSINEDNEATPVPQAASSSAQSTPLPSLPGRNGHGGVVGDGQNMMTLREQENVINKIDKENFGLKLKIHYLEDQLGKAGPELNRAALKENTDLKVTRVTMQRDLHRCKKSLLHAERDLESCQLELQGLREKANSRHADKTLQKELEWMREEVESKESEIYELREGLKSAQSKESEEVEKLREEVGELEFTIREKDRQIDDKDDEIEDLRTKESEHAPLAGLEEELEHAKGQIEDLQESLDQAKSESQETETACQQALQEKEQAVEDLNELQEEMANKSVHTQGFSRQLEDKASKLEEDLTQLRTEYAEIQEHLESKVRNEYRLREELKNMEDELSSERTRLQDELELAHYELRVAQRERDTGLSRLQEAEDELLNKGDAKSLLQNRHDALTSESKSLQDDLDRARRTVTELEDQAEIQQQQSRHALEDLRLHHKDEVDHLNDQMEEYRRDLEDKTSRIASDKEKWENMRRSLELQKDQAEQQANGYKRTVDQLQQVETTKSGREEKLQNIIESEKQRHQQQEESLNRQVKELNNDISSKRQAAETQRKELVTLKEDLRVSRRERDDMKERIQSLEDELLVLQASLEDEQQYAKDQRKVGVSESLNITRDKQALRNQLADAHAELSDLRLSISEIQTERDELQSQLNQAHNQVDDTYRLDQDKVDLRKSKLRLDGEVNRLKVERQTLQEAKGTLQVDLDSEIQRAAAEENRLLAEIDQLHDKLFMANENRDRELLSAKSKGSRLEARLKELEALLDREPAETGSSANTPDSSILRQNLDEARKKQRASLQREADLKSSVRHLKSRITDLETENHELQANKFEVISPASSPSSRLQEEIRSLREQLLSAHKTAKSLRSKNHELQQNILKEDEQRDLHELLKSSTLEAESLTLKLSERDARIGELRAHLRRVREDRTKALKRADSFDRELQTLQDQYDKAMDDIPTRSERKGRHEKEIRGLGKEILWLRARLAREKQFRNNLAWSKGLMELGERVRVACNETDLKMIAQMGVEAPLPETKPDLRRKLKSVFLTALATARMQRMASEWTKSRKIGEGLRKAKSEVLKRREQAKKTGRIGS